MGGRSFISSGTVVGFFGSGRVAGSVALAGVAVAVGALVLAVWHRQLVLAWLVIVASAIAAGISLAGWPIDSARELSYGLYAAGIACGVAALGCHVLNIAHTRTIGAASTVAGLLIVAGLTVPHSAGAVIGIAVVLLAVAPGCPLWLPACVPQLPTAGQDLAVSDKSVDDIDGRSHRAHFVYEGICLGLTMVVVTALAYLALTSATTPIVSTLLCLALCFAVLLHSARHRQVVATWSLTVLAATTAICAPVTVAVADFYGHAHVTLWIAGCVPIVLALASPWWAPRISSASPTIFNGLSA